MNPQPTKPSRRLAAAGALLAAAALSAGCESMALTMFGVGASTGVSHTLNGTAYHTFTASSARVKGATITALGRMSIRVDSAKKAESGEIILATASDRKIEVEIESLSPNTTRMRTVARQGLFYDSATAMEIIFQTEKLLGNA